MTVAPVFDHLAALAEPIRGRLLLLLESQPLTVRELQQALQLPQSTVSRHLKVLADGGWVASREEGTSNWYRLALRDLPAPARRLWQAVREPLAGTVAARGDADRLRSVLAARHATSQRFFASAAGQWDRLRRELFGERAELQALLGLLDGDWTVGDLGCGTGVMTEALAPFVRRVIAVDESAAMLRAARQRLGSAAGVEFRTGALESLPVTDGELDAAVLGHVLHHVSEPDRVLGETRRVLRPGGKLLVLDLVPHDRAEYRETMGHQWLGFAEVELAEWLAAAAFTDVRHRPLPPDPAAKGPGLFVLTARAA